MATEKQAIREEPILTEEDHRIWNKWKRICLLHARTNSFKRHVDQSVAAINDMVKSNPKAYIAWSAGKDSTAMTHLIRVRCGHDLVAMTIRYDSVYPGETEYIDDYAQKWDVRSDVIFETKSSLATYALRIAGDRGHRKKNSPTGDLFFPLVTKYREEHGCPGVFLGLRAGESKARVMNARRGAKYTKKNGETVCQPIVRWSDKDVFGYLFSNGIEPFEVYQCCRLSESPGRIRDGSFLPGHGACYGGAIWLRTYYPSLYAKAKKLLPGLTQFA